MVAIAQHLSDKKTTAPADEAVAELYERAFLGVARFVSRRGGSLEQAKDLFHDALVAYLEGAARENRSIRATQEAYVLGIAKHLWLRKYRQQQREVAISEAEQQMAVPEDFYPDVQEKRLLRLLELTGKKCLDLLRAFYYQSLPMKKLVQTLGYANEHVASVQKYKCLEKVRRVVKAKSMTHEDFTE